MSQSRLGSAWEAVAGTAIGFVVSVLATPVILSAAGMETPSAVQAIGITAAFTALSVVRSYVVRRVFNRGAAA